MVSYKISTACNFPLSSLARARTRPFSAVPVILYFETLHTILTRYDIATGYMMPNKKCVEKQLQLEKECGEEPKDSDGAQKCDRMRNKWLGECVYGDHKIEKR